MTAKLVPMGFFSLAHEEMRRAQRKFPSTRLQMAALTEEVGELANALIEHARSGKPAEEVYAEAVQVAAMAARIALEGSAEFPYVCPFPSGDDACEWMAKRNSHRPIVKF